jgi:hypothetical protein
MTQQNGSVRSPLQWVIELALALLAPALIKASGQTQSYLKVNGSLSASLHRRISMRDQLGFIFKVLTVSGLISVGIKRLGPELNLSATTALVLGVVLLPSIVLGAVLLFQLLSKHRQIGNHQISG